MMMPMMTSTIGTFSMIDNDFKEFNDDYLNNRINSKYRAKVLRKWKKVLLTLRVHALIDPREVGVRG